MKLNLPRLVNGVVRLLRLLLRIDMKIYYHGRSVNHKIFVEPAVDHPNVSRWRYEDGRSKQFEVHFINGVAEVEDNLGEYMIGKGLASRSKIISDIREVA